MRRVLILGATSAIAVAVARRFAADGDRIALVARNRERLQALADDLRARGAAQVETEIADLTEHVRHRALIEQAHRALGGLDTALIAHGSLPDQAACARDFERTRAEFETNALSTLSLMSELAGRFEENGSGTLAVIGSVAGDRGRQSNYVYGAAKGTVALFAQGLRNRLHGRGVRVITIKPGFVDTPMTAAFDKGALWAQPDRVGADIHRAIERGRDVVYTPWFWRWIMLVIRLIPEAVFKRLKL
jgi:decaprenylphospho-beta-D-erythro-pentofuranosid-2-ulose 2-reductase